MRKHAIQSTLYIRTSKAVRTSMEYTAVQPIARLARSSRATHACPLARSRSPSLAHAMTHPYAAHTRLSRLALKRMRSINSSEYRFWCSRCMMSMCPARENTQAMSAMPINSRGIEAFACVWGGGADLMAGAGHVAVGGPSDRQAVRGHQPASAAMAHARQGLGHRPFGPGQILPGLKRPSLRRCGRRKPEHGG